MREPNVLLEPGTEIVTHKTLGPTSGFLVGLLYLQHRTPNVKAKIAGIVGGHGGDLYWVTHDDGTQSVYCYTEFELASPTPCVHEWQHRCGKCGASSEFDGLTETERTGVLKTFNRIAELVEHDSPVWQIAAEYASVVADEQRHEQQMALAAHPKVTAEKRSLCRHCDHPILGHFQPCGKNKRFDDVNYCEPREVPSDGTSFLEGWLSALDAFVGSGSTPLTPADAFVKWQRELKETAPVCEHLNTRHDACSNDRYCHDCKSIIERSGKPVEPVPLRVYQQKALERGVAQKARLDADGTAKPLTELVAVVDPEKRNHCWDRSDSSNASSYILRRTTAADLATPGERVDQIASGHRQIDTPSLEFCARVFEEAVATAGPFLRDANNFAARELRRLAEPCLSTEDTDWNCVKGARGCRRHPQRK